jgi:hypothetical protein
MKCRERDGENVSEGPVGVMRNNDKGFGREDAEAGDGQRRQDGAPIRLRMEPRRKMGPRDALPGVGQGLG